jgi:hypothetical protein
VDHRPSRRDPARRGTSWAVLRTDRTDLRLRERPGDLLEAIPGFGSLAARSELTLPGLGADALTVDLDADGPDDDRGISDGDYSELVAEIGDDLPGLCQVLGHAGLLQGDESRGRLLLLQIDTTLITDEEDEDRRAYFYVDAADLRAGRFDRVHCTLQR